jgi:phytoene dehydrogenase-like protein
VSFWFRRWKNGPAAWKIDLALDGDIPWQSEICRRAGTVHVGGTLAEVVHAEQQIHRGVMPDRPFVLVGQQYLADPSRSRGSTNPIWMYAHVPNGYSGDATEVALNHVERFAPGFRERILRCVVSTPAGLQEYNPNFRGGDILTGANNVRQLVFRPRPALDPYYLGVEGHYLCSAATPPGAGVHGMCGQFAAQSALKRLGHGG